VDETTYRVWLEPLRPLRIDETTLVLEAPTHTCGWIRERFGTLLRTCAAAVLERDATIEIVPAAVTSSPPSNRNAGAASPTRRARLHAPARAVPHDERPVPALDHRLNPRLTFEHFVIGDSNRLAHAAALTVAELPGHAYNPLFICGAPGIGKTHLLHAIANLLTISNPGLSVCTTTGEVFTSEFQLALAGGDRLRGFKSRFRELDVLLLDDVQFLERKARTEEEFFHTFNTLYEGGAQLVLTSDRPPRNLQALEDRLRERFEAGLVADISHPDINTRLAILRKRAQDDRIELADDELLHVIARRVTINVRALEGALIRVVAYGSLTGRPLTAELASEVLDGLYPQTHTGPPSMAEIQAATCQHFSISLTELLSSSRAARVAWPRQLAMYLARELTSSSLPAIGRDFGGRDHTTVMHALKRAEAKIHSDSHLQAAVDSLREQLAHKHS